MNSFWTVFITVFSGVVTFVIGQIVVKLVLEPVQDLKRTIGQISHALIECANVIGNPTVTTMDEKNDTSKTLRNLSSQLHAHLYLVPRYVATSKIFRLPSKENLLSASYALIGLSNGVYRASERGNDANDRRIERIYDSLGIYLSEDSRTPNEEALN